MANGRGVRKVSENIMQDGRTIIITENDREKLDWARIPDGTLRVDPDNGQIFIKIKGESEWIPAGLTNDGTIMITRDARIGYEIFIVKNADNGDGTFTYTTEDGVERVSYLMEDGSQVFELEKGSYTLNLNKLEVIVDDLLHRSVASGGIVEIDEERFALSPVEDGSEITVKYIQNYTASSTIPRFYIDANQPSVSGYGDFWVDISD